MLSRIAESLFWIGRYVERADDTARILDVHVHMLLEDSPLDEQLACADLLAAMGIAGDAKPDELDVASVVQVLAYDRKSPLAIAGALQAARENARGAREAISSEMWECLNTTHNALPQQIATSHRLGPHGFFTFIRARTAMMSGLSDSTMSRDESWRFLVLGRSLERVDMTARLLSLRFGSSRHLPGRVALLRSCGAYEAYLRTHRGVLDTSRVVRFLLLDRTFPRSVFHALSTAEECLADLSPGRGQHDELDEARMALGRARTRLEFTRVEDLLTDLPANLEWIADTCRTAGGSVAQRFFRAYEPREWTPESPS
ncbi:MAG: hypothetical protein QOG53_3348 [Frankiales bacterium]|jgi:uncharacterized alpha-E superfamily protein|nr:hypothetical protein [Frankiales bacterium]